MEQVHPMLWLFCLWMPQMHLTRLIDEQPYKTSCMRLRPEIAPAIVLGVRQGVRMPRIVKD